jgi:hypothetical protein
MSRNGRKEEVPEEDAAGLGFGGEGLVQPLRLARQLASGQGEGQPRLFLLN